MGAKYPIKHARQALQFERSKKRVLMFDFDSFEPLLDAISDRIKQVKGGQVFENNKYYDSDSWSVWLKELKRDILQALDHHDCFANHDCDAECSHDDDAETERDKYKQLAATLATDLDKEILRSVKLERKIKELETELRKTKIKRIK